jgi:hypothetical protein
MHEMDQIIELQLKIARAGELERLCWWRVDATDALGGGDFFSRLVGSHSGLSSAEAAMTGATLKEKRLIDEAGATAVVTLFNPQVELKNQIQQRWQHFKLHPDDTPKAIAVLLDHKLEFKSEELTQELESYTKPRFERTAVGRKAKGDKATSFL